MAGLDGIQNKIDRASRWTRTSTTCRPRSSRTCRSVPGSLDEALEALEDDHEFLLQGDVFTEDVIETWINYKRRERGRRRSACGRTRTSSACTSTSDPGPLRGLGRGPAGC